MAGNLGDFLRMMGVIPNPQGAMSYYMDQNGQQQPYDPAALTGAAPQPNAPPPALAMAPPPSNAATGLAGPDPAMAAPPGPSFAPPPQSPAMAAPPPTVNFGTGTTTSSLPPPSVQMNPDAVNVAPVQTPWGQSPYAPPPSDPLAGKGMGYIPQMTWPEKLMLMGAGLKDLGDIGIGGPGGHYDQTLGGIRQWNMSMLQRQQRQALIQAGAFAGDPVAANSYLWDPTDINKAVAERYKPVIGREAAGIFYGPQGTGAPPPAFSPKYGEHGNTLYMQTPGGAAVQGQLPETAQDTLARAQTWAIPADVNAKTTTANADMLSANARMVDAAKQDWVLDGADNQGRAMYHNKNNGQQVVTDTVLGARTGAGVAGQKIEMLVGSGVPRDVATKEILTPGLMTPEKAHTRAVGTVLSQEAAGTMDAADRKANVDAITQYYLNAGDGTAPAAASGGVPPAGSDARAAGATALFR